MHAGLGRGYGDLLKPIAFRGELIFTEDTRFTLPAPFAPLDPEVATKEVARRYLTRYGPATREDLAKWFGHPSAPQAGKWFPDEVVETEFGLALPEDAEAIEARRRRRAPCGCCRRSTSTSSPRRATSGRARAPERVYRPGGWFSPVLLVDGVMAGVWARRGRRADDRAVHVAGSRPCGSPRRPRPPVSPQT